MIGKLTFMNADAKPHNCSVTVSADCVSQVMAWYGAYYAGDRYTVAFEGRNIPMDHNGEPTRHVEGLGNHTFDELGCGQSAAQSDYEARILAALEVTE